MNLAETIKIGGHDSSSAGAQLLKSALEQPFRILMLNSAINPDEWLPQVKKAKAGQGVNVNSPSKLVDLKSNGVVDPTRVTKEAIQNAVSIAGTSMTMGALVVDVPLYLYLGRLLIAYLLIHYILQLIYASIQVIVAR